MQLHTQVLKIRTVTTTTKEKKHILTIKPKYFYLWFLFLKILQKLRCLSFHSVLEIFLVNRTLIDLTSHYVHHDCLLKHIL